MKVSLRFPSTHINIKKNLALTRCGALPMFGPGHQPRPGRRAHRAYWDHFVVGRMLVGRIRGRQTPHRFGDQWGGAVHDTCTTACLAQNGKAFCTMPQWAMVQCGCVWRPDSQKWAGTGKKPRTRFWGVRSSQSCTSSKNRSSSTCIYK